MVKELLLLLLSKTGGLSRTQTSQHLLMKEIGFPITLKPIILVLKLRIKLRTVSYQDTMISLHHKSKDWSPYEDLNPNRLAPNQERYQITLYGDY